MRAPAFFGNTLLISGWLFCFFCVKSLLPLGFAIASSTGIALTFQVPALASNLVTNGTFESSTTNSGRPDTSGIGHIDKIVTLPGWLKTCINNCGGGHY